MPWAQESGFHLAQAAGTLKSLGGGKHHSSVDHISFLLDRIVLLLKLRRGVS
jgi:hypothetical protein